MTNRQKKGIGFSVTGGLFILASVVFFVVPATPDWVASILSIAGIIGGALGFTIVTPNTED